MKSTKRFFAVLLALACATAASWAQDKALLETLVKKGMLTQQEATKIAKESVAVKPAAKQTQTIKVFGGLQGWFKWSENNVSEGTGDMEEISGFELRFVKVGLEADVGNGWTATLVMDFGSGGDNRNYLDKVVISKKVDVDYIDGTLQIGLRKSNMGAEQITDDFGMLAIDRSVATNFFTQAGFTNGSTKYFGSRTVGVFWDGEIPTVDGLYYSAAITSELTEAANTASTVINNINANSGLSYYVAVGYKNVIDLDGEALKYDIGVNTGYASKGFTRGTSKYEIWGVNPYLTLKYGGWTAVAEMFYQSVENGRSDGSNASPLGANVIVAYKFDLSDTVGAIEPVLRFSYVSANELGVAVTADRTTYYFDSAKTVFFGINWYNTEAIKTSIGYEYGKYTSGKNAAAREIDNNTVMAQLQVVF